MASHIGHYDMMSYFAIAQNDAVGRVRYQLLEVLVAVCVVFVCMCVLYVCVLCLCDNNSDFLFLFSNVSI